MEKVIINSYEEFEKLVGQQIGRGLFVAYVQLVSDYKGKNIIIRRLRRSSFWELCCWC